MKALSPLSVASIILFAPLHTQAEMSEIDDDSLSKMTGQAYVTVELDAKVSVDQLIYQDFMAAGDAAIAPDASGSIAEDHYGVLVLEGLSVLASNGEAISITQEIDINENGNLQVGISEISNLRLQVNNTIIGGSNASVETGERFKSYRSFETGGNTYYISENSDDNTAVVAGVPVLGSELDPSLAEVERPSGLIDKHGVGAIRLDVESIAAISQEVSSGGGSGQGLVVTSGDINLKGGTLTYVDGQFTDDSNVLNSISGNAMVISGLELSMSGATQKIDIEKNKNNTPEDLHDDFAMLQIDMSDTNINLGIQGISFATAAQYESAVLGNSDAPPSIGSVFVSGINMGGSETRIYGHK